MTVLLKELAEKYRKHSHGSTLLLLIAKKVFGGVGGRAKSLIRSVVMRKRSSGPVVQNAGDSAAVVS